MITSPEPTGVDMGQTHDDWHEWRHGTDGRLDAIEGRIDRIEHELRMIRWILGFMAAALVALIGIQVAVAQALLSLR